MQTDEISQAIFILYDMESNNCLMDKTIDELNYKISKYGISKNVTKPTRNIAQNPERSTGNYLRFAGLNGAIIGAIFGVIITIVKLAQNPLSHIISTIIAFVLSSLIDAVIYGIICGAIGCIVGLLIRFLIIVPKDRSTVKAQQIQFDQQFTSATNSYNAALRQDKKRVEYELKQKQLLIKERDQLIKRRSEAGKKLQSFYGHVKIDPNFQNIVTMSIMEEMVRLKISTKLEGTDGLYYLTKQELNNLKLWDYLEGIGRKLDNVLDKLDDIADAIDCLGKKINELNSTCYSLVQETIKANELSVQRNELLSEISTNTALSLYHQERIAKEQSYQSALMTYEFIDRRTHY